MKPCLVRVGVRVGGRVGSLGVLAPWGGEGLGMGLGEGAGPQLLSLNGTAGHDGQRRDRRKVGRMRRNWRERLSWRDRRGRRRLLRYCRLHVPAAVVADRVLKDRRNSFEQTNGIVFLLVIIIIIFIQRCQCQCSACSSVPSCDIIGNYSHFRLS